MSFGGILATALAGGASVIGKQAGDDIEAQRKADLMRQQADIEEQMRMRLAEFSEKQRRSGVLWETRGEGGAAKREYRKGEMADAAQADIDKARGMIPVTQEAARASAKTATDITKEQAADPAYLKSVSVLKLADPEVRARIAASAASANASAQQVKESAERLKQLQAVGEVATKVRGLQDTLSKTTDPAQRQAVEQQITDLGFNGKDIKSFLATAERAMTNGDTAMKVLLDQNADEATKAQARQQLAQANQFAEKAAGLAGIKLDGAAKPSQQQAHAEAEAAIKQGASREVVNARLAKLGYEPLGGSKSGGTVPGAARAATAKPEPEYRPASDGSGRMVDVNTGRTLTPEQSAILAKIQRGEPTTPRERALLND